MKIGIREYFKTLKDKFDHVIATEAQSRELQLDEAIDKTIQLIIETANSGRKILFIGNGASASISSHMATDFWKNACIRALAFNDSSLLTCVSNDYGYEHVFEKPIEMFGEKGDILIAISSSGSSENILKGALAAKKRGIKVVTFSGFENDNPLRSLGDINFYVPAKSYGYVEVAHHAICHCFVDNICQKFKKSKI